MGTAWLFVWFLGCASAMGEVSTNGFCASNDAMVASSGDSGSDGEMTARRLTGLGLALGFVLCVVIHRHFDNLPGFLSSILRKLLHSSSRHDVHIQVPMSKALAYQVDRWFTNTEYSKPLTLLYLTLALIFVGWLGLYAAGGASSYDSFWSAVAGAGIDWGFLSDDQEDKLLVRLVAMVLSVGGMLVTALMLGIVSDAISRKVDELAKGRSAVLEVDHTLILGWNDKIFCLVDQLCNANQSLGGAAIVVLAPMEKEEMEAAINEHNINLRGSSIICRSGNPLRPTHLHQVSVDTCRSIIVLADNTDPDQSDADALRIVLCLMGVDEQLVQEGRQGLQAHVVVELCDKDNDALVQTVGDDRVITVVSHDIIGRIMIQCARQPGLSNVLEDVIGFEGNEFYMKQWPELEGCPFSQVLLRFEAAVPLGVRTHAGRVVLNPDPDYIVQEGDEIVVLAEDDDTYSVGPVADAQPGRSPTILEVNPHPEKYLFLGWRRDMDDMICVLDEFAERGSELWLYSDTPLEDRRDRLLQGGLDPDEGLKNLTLIYDDPCLYGSLVVRKKLEALDMLQFSAILILADENASGHGIADADTRNLATLLLVRHLQLERMQRLQAEGGGQCLAGTPPSTVPSLTAPLAGPLAAPLATALSAALPSAPSTHATPPLAAAAPNPMLETRRMFKQQFSDSLRAVRQATKPSLPGSGGSGERDPVLRISMSAMPAPVAASLPLHTTLPAGGLAGWAGGLREGGRSNSMMLPPTCFDDISVGVRDRRTSGTNVLKEQRESAGGAAPDPLAKSAPPSVLHSPDGEALAGNGAPLTPLNGAFSPIKEGSSTTSEDLSAEGGGIRSEGTTSRGKEAVGRGGESQAGESNGAEGSAPAAGSSRPASPPEQNGAAHRASPFAAGAAPSEPSSNGDAMANGDVPAEGANSGEDAVEVREPSPFLTASQTLEAELFAQLDTGGTDRSGFATAAADAAGGGGRGGSAAAAGRSASADITPAAATAGGASGFRPSHPLPRSRTDLSWRHRSSHDQSSAAVRSLRQTESVRTLRHTESGRSGSLRSNGSAWYNCLQPEMRGTVVISEILDSKARQLIKRLKISEFVLSNELVSMVLAMVSENRAVYDILQELLRQEGNELYVQPPEHYLRQGELLNFYDVLARAHSRREIVLGYTPAGAERALLNPPNKAERCLSLDNVHNVIVLALYDHYMAAADGGPGLLSSASMLRSMRSLRLRSMQVDRTVG